MSRNRPRLLDVGCGDGSTALVRGWPTRCIYRGVDIDPEKVAAARDRGLDVVRGDVMAGLDAGADSYDIVVAKAVLEHVDDPLVAARECRRVLHPEGEFRVTVPSDRSYDVWGDYTHLRAFRRDALDDLLSDAGFASIEISPRMGWGSLGAAAKSLLRIAAPWTPYGYPRAWVATARCDGR